MLTELRLNENATTRPGKKQRLKNPYKYRKNPSGNCALKALLNIQPASVIALQVKAPAVEMLRI